MGKFLDGQTVVILGAGASAPYGFPIGVHLRNNIIDEHSDFKSMLQDLREPADAWEVVRETLAIFQRPSVDEFLAKYDDHASLMKLAIAHELIKVEDRRKLTHPVEQADSWYRKLYFDPDFLDADSQLGDGRLSFITFNYDLSLEQYFYDTHRVQHRSTEDGALEAVKKLRVTHIYGDIGPVVTLDTHGRHYGSKMRANDVRCAANRISTCFETRSLAAVDEAQGLIRAAENVLFLGFGYSNENLARLNLPNTLSRDALLGGTVYKCDGWKERLTKVAMGRRFFQVHDRLNQRPVGESLAEQLFRYTMDPAAFAGAVVEL